MANSFLQYHDLKSFKFCKIISSKVVNNLKIYFIYVTKDPWYYERFSNLEGYYE